MRRECSGTPYWYQRKSVCHLSVSHSVFDAILLFSHWCRVTHVCVCKVTIIGRRQAIIWNGWNIVKSKLRNNIYWNLKRNSYIFIQEDAFQNVVSEMAVILSRPQCVKLYSCFVLLGFVIWTCVVHLCERETFSSRWLHFYLIKLYVWKPWYQPQFTGNKIFLSIFYTILMHGMERNVALKLSPDR